MVKSMAEKSPNALTVFTLSAPNPVTRVHGKRSVFLANHRGHFAGYRSAGPRRD